MYALVLTLFFSATTESGVNRFNQTILTKTQTSHFTKEECEYVQEILLEDMQQVYLKKKQESDVVQLSLSCVEVNPLIQRNSNGAIPIPENSNRIPERNTPNTKQKFNFNGAKEV